MIGFEAYQVGAWYQDGLIVKPPTRHQSKKPLLRGNSWKSLVAGTFVAIGVGSVVHVPAGLTGTTALSLFYGDRAQLPEAANGFAGQQLPNVIGLIRSAALKPPADLRSLLERTAKLRHAGAQDVEAWASRLTDDVKNADD